MDGKNSIPNAKYNNGYNFKDSNYREKPDNSREVSFESLAEERELADYAKNQIIYTGLFIDPDEIYSIFPPTLSHKIRDPHVTISYRPGAEKVFLDALGSNANIRAVGYGNDGQNEGLLVEVMADDPTIQKSLNERMEPDNTGEIKPVPIHVTLSIAEGAEAVNTRNLDFKKLDTPIDLTGNYKLFRKDGILVSDKETIKEMQASSFSTKEVKDPDRPSQN